MNLRQLLFGIEPVAEAPASTSSGNRSAAVAIQPILRRLFAALNSFSRSMDYEGIEWDLALIDTAYQQDSYVRRAVDKHVELIFKAGWQLVGRNTKAVEYVRTRLAVMAEATGTPTEFLLMGMAEQLVKYANVIVVKQRDPNYPWPRYVRVRQAGTRPPVVGYFLVPPSQMEAYRDRYGNIRRWRQRVGNYERVFNPADVVHITYAREPGQLFGYPFLLAAISDVRALRQAEEQVLRLIYRNLFPFLHAIVGNEEAPGTAQEVAEVQGRLMEMELEGGLATTERVKLQPVAVDQIIDASRYLDYFEKRVFTALGVSQTLMGRAETASRSAADTLSVEMRDRIKAFQRILANGIDAFIISELLREGGFDPIADPRDDVDFVFNEIDIDTKVKMENQAVFLYEHNAITEDEMRSRLGMDPLTETDRKLLHFFRITLPRLLATRGEAPDPSSEESRSQLLPPKLPDSMGQIPSDVPALVRSHIDQMLAKAPEQERDELIRAVMDAFLLTSVK